MRPAAGEQMAILPKCRGKERSFLEAREIFEDGEFHGVALVGFGKLFRDEPTDHSDLPSQFTREQARPDVQWW